MNDFKTSFIKSVAITALNNYRHFLLGRIPEAKESFSLIERAIILEKSDFSGLVILSFSGIEKESCLFFLNKILRKIGIVEIKDLNVEILNTLIEIACFEEIAQCP
jgi:hypothetical protein